VIDPHHTARLIEPPDPDTVVRPQPATSLPQRCGCRRFAFQLRGLLLELRPLPLRIMLFR
jgi:hypothetical protein